MTKLGPSPFLSVCRKMPYIVVIYLTISSLFKLHQLKHKVAKHYHVPSQLQKFKIVTVVENTVLA